MQKLVGVVVLYHPESTVITNIETYLPHVHTLFLIDNSQPSAKELFEPLLREFSNKLKYVHNSKNEGIAKPLNQAAEFGIQNNFDWLLTMDQDSFFHPGHFDRILKFTDENETSKIAIVTPFHHTLKDAFPVSAPRFSEMKIAMTSGNLLQLNAFQKCGPFNEQLFIDSVDHEYCLRLRKNGYKIIRVNDVVLDHKLGDMVSKKFLFFNFRITNHSAVRMYFITRNRLYVMFKYCLFDFFYFLSQAKDYVKDFLKICLIEDDKVRKLFQFGRGTWHFIKREYPGF
jgi:rhamnosyltransferase